MGQAHSRAYRDIPVYFPESGIRPRLVVGRRQRPGAGRARDAELRVRRPARSTGASSSPATTSTSSTSRRRTRFTASSSRPRRRRASTSPARSPSGSSPEATAAIEAAARRAGVISGCGYNYRWAPLVQYTRQLIADGRLGELTHYRGRFFSMYGRDRLGLLSWRFLQEEAGYGVTERHHVARHRHGPVHVRPDRPGRGGEGDVRQASGRCPSRAAAPTTTAASPATRPGR